MHKKANFLTAAKGGNQNELLLLGRYSCYLQCLMFIAQNDVPSAGQVLDYHRDCLSRGLIGSDCYVKDPVAVYNGFTPYGKHPVKAKEIVRSDNVNVKHKLAVIGAFVNGDNTHFVVMSNDGEYVIFDPIGDNSEPKSSGSVTVRNGNLTSFRILTS